MYRAVQNWSKLFFYTQSLVLISLNILMQILKLNEDFEYFIHVSRVLKWGVEASGIPPHIDPVLTLYLYK